MSQKKTHHRFLCIIRFRRLPLQLCLLPHEQRGRRAKTRKRGKEGERRKGERGCRGQVEGRQQRQLWRRDAQPPHETARHRLPHHRLPPLSRKQRSGRTEFNKWLNQDFVMMSRYKVCCGQEISFAGHIILGSVSGSKKNFGDSQIPWFNRENVPQRILYFVNPLKHFLPDFVISSSLI
jgi:hypothetical protein